MCASFCSAEIKRKYISLLQLLRDLSNRRCRLVDGQTGFTNAEFDIMFINLQKRWEHLYLETPGSGRSHHCKEVWV